MDNKLCDTTLPIAHAAESADIEDLAVEFIVLDIETLRTENVNLRDGNTKLHIENAVLTA